MNEESAVSSHVAKQLLRVKKTMKKLIKLCKKQMSEAWDGRAKLPRNCVHTTQLYKKLETLNNFKGPE